MLSCDNLVISHVHRYHDRGRTGITTSLHVKPSLYELDVRQEVVLVIGTEASDRA